MPSPSHTIAPEVCDCALGHCLKHALVQRTKEHVDPTQV